MRPSIDAFALSWQPRQVPTELTRPEVQQVLAAMPDQTTRLIASLLPVWFRPAPDGGHAPARAAGGFWESDAADHRQQGRGESLQSLTRLPGGRAGGTTGAGARAATEPEAVGEVGELRLHDRLQDEHHRPLEEFVLQRRDADRALASIAFGDIRTTHRGSPVTTRFRSGDQVGQAVFNAITGIGGRRLTVYPCAPSFRKQPSATRSRSTVKKGCRLSNPRPFPAT